MCTEHAHAFEQTRCNVFDSWNMIAWQPAALLSLCCFPLMFLDSKGDILAAMPAHKGE